MLGWGVSDLDYVGQNKDFLMAAALAESRRAGETELSPRPAINHPGVNFYARGRAQLTCVEIGQEKFVGGRDFNLDASWVHCRLQAAG